MKARFIIERIFVNAIELELDNELIVPGPNHIFENIMHHAKKQYSDLVDAGKEPEIGDQIDVKLIPVCDHCGEEIVGEDETPCFVDGHMVCESCYDLLNEFTRREEDLEDAGVDLYKIADLITEKIRYYNGHPTLRGITFAEIETIGHLLKAMNIPFSFSRDDTHSFTLNGKTYTI